MSSSGIPLGVLAFCSGVEVAAGGLDCQGRLDSAKALDTCGSCVMLGQAGISSSRCCIPQALRSTGHQSKRKPNLLEQVARNTQATMACGSPVITTEPTQMDVPTAVSITVGDQLLITDQHACPVTIDGQVHCWGGDVRIFGNDGPWFNPQPVLVPRVHGGPMSWGCASERWVLPHLRSQHGWASLVLG